AADRGADPGLQRLVHVTRAAAAEQPRFAPDAGTALAVGECELRKGHCLSAELGDLPRNHDADPVLFFAELTAPRLHARSIAERAQKLCELHHRDCDNVRLDCRSRCWFWLSSRLTVASATRTHSVGVPCTPIEFGAASPR